MLLLKDVVTKVGEEADGVKRMCGVYERVLIFDEYGASGARWLGIFWDWDSACAW